MLWSLEELVRVTGGTLIGSAPQRFDGISIDTRTLKPGEIFVAIKGDRFDGHDFVSTALQSGAGIAIVSMITDQMRSAGALLHVPGTPLEALEAMARAARSRCNGKIIAVTGSVGKTSTKEMLLAALSASGKTHASAASFNNHWGVPLTLARMPRDSAFGVFEIGMNHAGEITPLVAMVSPHVAIITTVAASHLGHFKSLDEIADAKAEILTGLVDGGVAVLNRDSDYFDKLAHAATACKVSRIVGFGHHSSSDVRMTKSFLHANCTCMTINVLGEDMTMKLGLPGAHMAQNALAVLAAVKLTGADLAKAAMALADTKPAKGRGVVEKLRLNDGEFVLLDESYNANPASMKAALDLLRLRETRGKGKRIAVLGDMLELGESAADLHRDISSVLDKVDLVFASGPLMKNLWSELSERQRGHYATTSSALLDPLMAVLVPGDVVMIKGSLGSKMGPVAEALRSRYADAKGNS